MRTIFVLTTLAFSATAFADDTFQVTYAANLNVGDSVVNITNSGASNSSSLCANLYTFDPAEEMISCCSCLVTPNALQSLSVKKSLISNPLTPAVPTAVVIKMLATSGPCTAQVGENQRPHGLLAWGTTIHQTTPPPPPPPPPGGGAVFAAATPAYGVTERAFQQADLSDAELDHLYSTCGFIQSNGSGFGICKGCAAGGLGAASAQ